MTNKRKNAFLAPYLSAFARKIEVTAWNNINLPGGSYAVQCFIQEGLPGFVTISAAQAPYGVSVTYDEGGNIYVDADFSDSEAVVIAKKILDAVVDMPEVKPCEVVGEPPAMSESEEDSIRNLMLGLMSDALK